MRLTAESEINNTANLMITGAGGAMGGCGGA